MKPNSTHPLFRSVLLPLLCLASACTADARATEAPPNVVFVMADDLGWVDTAVYGSRFYQTPNVDRLAASGVRFTDAYSANPLCSPTRASVLTGQYPGRLRLTTPAGHLAAVELNAQIPDAGPADQPATNAGTNTRLDNEHFTLGNLFKGAGYRTAFVGKWHLGSEPYVPEGQDFDLVVGGRRNPGPPPPGGFFAPWEVDTMPKVPDGTHITDAITDATLGFIDEAEEAGEPFFVCLWYYDVHAAVPGEARTRRGGPPAGGPRRPAAAAGDGRDGPRDGREPRPPARPA